MRRLWPAGRRSTFEASGTCPAAAGFGCAVPSPHPGSLRSHTVVWGFGRKACSALCTPAWGPASKQGRPLVGGGSCLVRGFARSRREPPRLAAPGGSAGRDTRLWSRGGCSMRGQMDGEQGEGEEEEEEKEGATARCGVSAGGLRCGAGSD